MGCSDRLLPSGPLRRLEEYAGFSAPRENPFPNDTGNGAHVRAMPQNRALKLPAQVRQLSGHVLKAHVRQAVAAVDRVPLVGTDMVRVHRAQVQSASVGLPIHFKGGFHSPPRHTVSTIKSMGF